MKRPEWFIGIAAFAAMILIAGCGRRDNPSFLGSAIVDETTFQIATTVQGAILAVYKQEGQPVAANEMMALVDTVPLLLKKEQSLAGISELEGTIASERAQIGALESDVGGAQREFTRISGLAEKGSVPQRDRDNLLTQFESTKFHRDAARKVLSSLFDKEKGLKAQVDQLDNQIHDCYVRAPAPGIVLTRYRNTGEVIAPGNPIYEIGRYDTLYADFFVPQPVLATIKYGQAVRIRLDYDDPSVKHKEKFIPATITWIGNEAEFSPKNIQTRESRNELVFKIRASIPNQDGMLKRGLPVEVWR